MTSFDMTLVIAKRVYDGSWIQGRFVYLESYKKPTFRSYRIYNSCSEIDCGDFYPDFYEVDPDTICRFTGIQDVNDEKIFEGDLLVLVSESTGESIGDPHPVIWNEIECCWSLDFKFVETDQLRKGVPYKIVGNIYGSRKLL